jgi:hypothetical protein
MANIVSQINKALDSIGGAAEGNFKIFSANSRLHLFLKAEKVPGKPAFDISVDLPGDMDNMVASGANAIMDATGVGNAPESDSQQSN